MRILKKCIVLTIVLFFLGANISVISKNNENQKDMISSLIGKKNDSHWDNLFDDDFRLTYHMDNEGAWDPDVGFTDEKFFITWEEGIFKNNYPPIEKYYKIQIRGCFYSKEGKILGERFDITPWDDGMSSTFRCEDPSIVYGEKSSQKSFFIAYEYYNDPTDDFSKDIRGCIVPIDASGIDDVTHFDICVLDGNQDDPVVAFDTENKRFFVVWADARDGDDNYNIYGKFYDINGNQIGGEKIISEYIKNQCEPSVSFDSSNCRYIVAWEHAEHPEKGPFEIWGKVLDSEGNSISNEKRFSQISSEHVDYIIPHVEFCKDRYLIEWHQADWSERVDLGPLYGIMVDTNGNIMEDVFKIIDGEYQVNDMCSFSDSLFFISFDDTKDIWGKFISLDGCVLSEVIKISDDCASHADWASIYCYDNNLIALWEDIRVDYPNDLYDNKCPDVFLNMWSFSNQPPLPPSELKGELSGLVHHPLNFNTISNDTEIDDIQFYFDWDDGTADWTDFVANNEEATESHIWREAGLYKVKCKTRDRYFAESVWSDEFEITISDSNNNPPNTPSIIQGEQEIVTDCTHIYKASVTDPEEDKVQLCFDWGDKSSLEWTEYLSTELGSLHHIWREPGTYEIRVKARDESGSVSYWSDPFIVTCLEDDSNEKPDKPILTGPDSGSIKRYVEFTVVSNDPNNDQIKFKFDWGDCDECKCYTVYGPYFSGENITVKKAWYQPGEYNITVSAIDESGSESLFTNHDIKITIIKNSNRIFSDFLYTIFDFLRNN